LFLTLSSSCHFEYLSEWKTGAVENGKKYYHFPHVRYLPQVIENGALVTKLLRQ